MKYMKNYSKFVLEKVNVYKMIYNNDGCISSVIEGKRDQLVGKIQERYGYAKDQAEKEVNDWEKRNDYRW